jgi:enhancer of mRNA-decapping protein 4
MDRDGSFILARTPVEQHTEGTADKWSIEGIRSLFEEQHRMMREQREQSEEVLCRKIEELLSKSVREQQRLMSEHTRQTQQQIDRLTKDIKVQEKQKLDRLSATASTAVQSKVEKVVKNEMKNAVVPAVTKAITGMSEQVNATVAQRAEAGVRDTVSKVVKGKALSDAIASNISASLQPMVQAKFEECFTPLFTNMAASFEQSCSSMCQQVNTALNTGTSQYLSHLQQHLDTHQQTLGSGRDAWMAQVVAALQKSSSTVVENQKRVSQELQTMIQNEMMKVIQGMSDMVQTRLPDLMAGKVNECFERNLHRFVMDSEQLKEQQKTHAREKAKGDIDHYLRNHQVGKAFDVALTNSDLPLVMYICKQINPEELFDQQASPVTQAVLLSLVHHLAADLNEDLDLKIKYIEQCVLAIDDTDSMVREHIPNVLGHLVNALTTKEKALASHQPAKARQIRKLRMVAERLAQIK